MDFEPKEFQQQRVFHALEALRWRSTGDSSSPLNMLLVGESGVGKTHAMRNYVCDANSQSDKSGERIISVLYLEVPFPFSLRALYLGIQESLDFAVPETVRSTMDGLQHQTISRLKSRGVEMIVFDEAQHMFGSQKVPSLAAMEFITQLGNHAHVPIVLVGSPYLQELIGGEPRYARRFSVFNLEPFGNG